MKAQDLLVHCHSMVTLARRVQQLKEPYSQFSLDATIQLAPPKWSRETSWTPRDDAMLLLGVFKYGLGNWSHMAADERLKLDDKLASAAAGKTHADHYSNILPKGSEQVRRCRTTYVLHLLFH